jgi:hypothetical protein
MELMELVAVAAPEQQQVLVLNYLAEKAARVSS